LWYSTKKGTFTARGVIVTYEIVPRLSTVIGELTENV